jgi:hypothetical protein
VGETTRLAWRDRERSRPRDLNVRHCGARSAQGLVRHGHHVGVNEGIRGVRDGCRGSCRAFTLAACLGRRPGRRPRSASSDARNAAHVSNNTPRTSGNRDLGSAGYGWAPVKRRRRPVTEGGVVARFLGSLIDPAGDNGRPAVRSVLQAGHPVDDPRGRKGTPRPRVSRTPLQPAWRSSRARSSWRSSHSSY